MTKFVIFANARSGSTSLAKLLYSSEDVNLCLEPFHPNYCEWNPGERNYHEFIKDGETMNQALDEIFDNHNAMKVLVYQFPKEIYLSMLARQDLKFVFLTRRNLAQAALSSIIGEQTSIWHKSDMDERAYENLKPVDVSEIQKKVDYIGKTNPIYADYLNECRKEDYLALFYESMYSEDMDKNIAKITKICKFLNVSLPPADAIEKYMKPSKAKQNQKGLYRKIPNYNEVKKKFEGIFS